MKAKRTARLFTTVILLFAVSAGFVSGCGRRADARNIVVADLMGDTISISKGTEEEIKAQTGARLAEDYSLITGSGSNAYLTLDAASVAKVANESKVTAVKVNARLLRLNTVYGEMCVQADKSQAKDPLEIQMGNSMLGVRGTFFIVSYKGGVGEVVLVEGTLALKASDGRNYTIHQGERAIIEQSRVFVIPIDYKSLTPFARECIGEYGDYLIGTGALTQEQIDALAPTVPSGGAEKTAEDGTEGAADTGTASTDAESGTNPDTANGADATAKSETDTAAATNGSNVATASDTDTTAKSGTDTAAANGSNAATASDTDSSAASAEPWPRVDDNEFTRLIPHHGWGDAMVAGIVPKVQWIAFFENVSLGEMEKYMQRLREAGFTIGEDVQDTTWDGNRSYSISASNQEGYFIIMTYTEVNNNVGIRMDAPGVEHVLNPGMNLYTNSGGPLRDGTAAGPG